MREQARTRQPRYRGLVRLALDAHLHEMAAALARYEVSARTPEDAAEVLTAVEFYAAGLRALTSEGPAAGAARCAEVALDAAVVALMSRRDPVYGAGRCAGGEPDLEHPFSESPAPAGTEIALSNSNSNTNANAKAKD